jgi:hypothetical protein
MVLRWRLSHKTSIKRRLEAQIAAAIKAYPEYVEWLESRDDALRSEFTPEGGRANSFLHMGMHLAIREQVATNRPSGITAIDAKLAERLGRAREAEHTMLDALGETL